MCEFSHRTREKKGPEQKRNNMATLAATRVHSCPLVSTSLEAGEQQEQQQCSGCAWAAHRCLRSAGFWCVLLHSAACSERHTVCSVRQCSSSRLGWLAARLVRPSRPAGRKFEYARHLRHDHHWPVTLLGHLRICAARRPANWAPAR